LSAPLAVHRRAHRTAGRHRCSSQQRLSFADAAIVTVARRHAPGLVATFDADFRGVKGVSVVPQA